MIDVCSGARARKIVEKRRLEFSYFHVLAPEKKYVTAPEFVK